MRLLSTVYCMWVCDKKINAEQMAKEGLSRVFVSVARKARIQSVVRNRTDSVAIVLENTNNPGNENAIMRTMDAFGFYLLHRISTNSSLSAQGTCKKSIRTDGGSRQWMTIRNWDQVNECAQFLKNVGGYKLVCATPDANKSIFELDVTERLAVVFGNESSGVSSELRSVCELSYALPMYGFVESLNVSVAAAITLFHLSTQQRKFGVSGIFVFISLGLYAYIQECHTWINLEC